MIEMSRVGAVAAVVAAVVALSGCGGGSDDDAKAASPTVSVSPSEESFDTALPDDPRTKLPEYLPGPEGEIDKKADEEGWVSSQYGSASELVTDICESLPESAVDGMSRPQWLEAGGFLADDGAKILEFGVPKLCPKWTSAVKQAASGDFERWVSSGEYEVTNSPAPFDPTGESDVQQIKPGTYQAKGKFSDCYWERTSQSGDIIDNQFVTQARVLTVTLQAGELFKNECGTFKPVG